jgi:hypothetical protein
MTAVHPDGGVTRCSDYLVVKATEVAIRAAGDGRVKSSRQGAVDRQFRLSMVVATAMSTRNCSTGA